jgi:hypothetical protein
VIRPQTKLRKLAEVEGFESATALIEAACVDSVCPAICCNEASPNCDYTEEMEPDQDRGWCEVCELNSMKSALILAGLI